MINIKSFLHQILWCTLLLISSNMNGQITSGSHFKAQSFEDMIGPYLMATQEYRKIEADIGALVEYVSEILSQDIDTEMRAKMNNEYKKLNELAEELSNNGIRGIRDKYNTIHRRVKSEVVNYNNRVAEAREKAEREARIAAEERTRIEAERHNPTEWGGTGFALKDGYIVTNHHVVEDANTISIRGIKGDFQRSYDAEVVAIDKINDIALLKVTSESFTGFGNIPYNVKTSISEVGEDVFVLGYPLTSTMGDEIKLTTGVISSKTGFQGDVSLYQISAPVQPGNSGGPLFDGKGNIVGIVSAKHQGAENVGYAIKTSYLRNLIESYVSTSLLPSSNQVSTLPLTGKVKSIKDFVFMVKCSKKKPTSDRAVMNNVGNRLNGNNVSTSKTYAYNNVYKDSKVPVYNKTEDGFEVFLPEIQTSYCEDLRILKVELNSKYTTIYLEFDNSIAGQAWINISPETHIIAGICRHKMIEAEGISVRPERYYLSSLNEKVVIKLTFPAISEMTEYISLVESSGSSWRFERIKLKQ